MCVNGLSGLEEVVPGGSCPRRSEDTPGSGHGHPGAWARGFGVSARRALASVRPLEGVGRSEWQAQSEQASGDSGGQGPT
jgi:hypothetical protein